MSSNHLNLYVIRNAKNLSSFETLCMMMFGAKKTKLNQKAQLTALREMAIYLSAVTYIDENVFSAITAFIKDLGDSDADRKLFRTGIFLLMEAVQEYSSRNDLTNKRQSVLVLNSMLGKELSAKGINSKQLLMWRCLGTIMYAHNAQARHLLLTNPNSVRNTEIETFVNSRLTSTFEGLVFPVKQKKSVLFGDDKEFLPKMLQWSAVLSAIVRTEEGLPRKSWENLCHGLTCSIYKPLTQHAFRALLNTAKTLKDPSLQLQFISTVLADRDGGAKGREPLNLSDMLCCTYYIRTLSALAYNCADLGLVDPTSLNNPSSELLKALVALFVEALRFLHSGSVKITTEMVNALLNLHHGPHLVCMINQTLRSKRVVSKSSKTNAIALITDALQTNLQATKGVESIDLPPLLRACETLGQFLVHRPYFSAKQQQRDGDTIASLWTTLRRHYRGCLMPKDDCPGSDAQRAGRALTQRQLRAQAGSSGGTCSGFATRSMWSWSSENASIATKAVSHSPHVLCALLRAQIWMAPDKRYCPKEHSLLWSAFADSLLSSWELITSTLSREFDVLTLLLPLLTQYFARVQASMCLKSTGDGRSNAPTPSASYATFIELGEVTVGSVTPEVGLHYSPVYVDVLLTLSEELVRITRSGIAVTFLHSVWKWLQLFTSCKQHKQQAAMQLKRDLRNKQFTSSPSSHIGAFNSGVFPSTLPALATGGVEKDVHISHESHADRALLTSIARMTVYAQQYHLHSASVQDIVGTAADEAARVMQNLYMSGMWHLVDNAMLCFSLALPPIESVSGDRDGSDAVPSNASEPAFDSHSSALFLVVKILSEAATQGELPNIRNSALLGLVKLSSQVLVLSERSELSLEKGEEAHILGVVFKDLAQVYLAQFGHTLDVTYRHVLQQLLGNASIDARRRAAGPQSCNVDLVVELVSHIFSVPGATPQNNGLSSVFTILQTAMKMLCAALTGGAALDNYRSFATAHAALSRNSFVLLEPATLPIEADDEDEEEEEEEEESIEAAPSIATPAATSAASGGGQYNFFDDDDLLGGWSSATTVLKPTIAPRPVLATAASVNLLDTEDMWIFDAPLVPEKPAKLSTGSSLKAGMLLDFFGQSAPLVPSPASNKLQTPAGDAFAPSIQAIPEPERKPLVLFRNIYDEDEPFSATSNNQVSAIADFEASPADFAPTGAHSVPVSAVDSAASHSTFPAVSPGLDWSNTSTHTGDGFDGFSASAPAFDSWGGADSTHSYSSAVATADDGFAPSAAPAATFAALSSPAVAVSAAPTIALPPVSAGQQWSGSSGGDWGDLGNEFVPSAASPAKSEVSANANDGFDSLFGENAAAASTKSAPPLARRVSLAPTGLAALSAEEQAAIAAAKRASRRASVSGGALSQSKSKTAAADPFSAAPLVPTNSSIPSHSASDAWAAPVSDGFTSTASSNSWPDDGFGSADPFAASASQALAAPAADDGFTATPADFTPTAAPTTGAYYGQDGYPPVYPPAYPPAHDPAYAYPPAAAHSYNFGYPAPDPNYPQQYAQQAYGAAPAGYPPAQYPPHQQYSPQQAYAAPGYPADPNYQYGYPPPPPAQQPSGGYYGQPPAAYPGAGAYPQPAPAGAQQPPPPYAGQQYGYPPTGR